LIVNILIANKNDLSNIKIIDFGISTRTDKFNYKRCGTLKYMAPELIA